jgi:hypothetical protein
MPRALLIPAAGFCFIFLCFWFKPEAPRAMHGINDFMGIYTGARLVGTPEQFNPDAYLREQSAATGWTAPSILYTRLPAFAMLLRPLGRLPYRAAYFTWQALSFAALIAFLILWPASDRTLLLCAACASFPLFANFIGGQDVAFLLLILAVAWRFAESRPFLAGTILGLLALKFHLFLLLPIFLIAQHRWKILTGTAATLILIVIASFTAAGPAWVSHYIHFVLQGQTNPSLRAMVNHHGLFEGLPHSGAIEIAASLAVAAIVAAIARQTTFAVGLSIALAGSLLTSHHAYPADALLLLPALLTLIAEFKTLPIAMLSTLLLTPLPFLLAPAVPLAAPVPLLLIVLLILVRGAAAKNGEAKLSAVVTACR